MNYTKAAPQDFKLLAERGVTLKATEQPIHTRSAAGKAFLDMLGVFNEFETNLRRERQLEGIAAAKARGAYTGANLRSIPPRFSACASREAGRDRDRTAARRRPRLPVPRAGPP